MSAVLKRPRLRSVAKWVALRLPFGVGRELRALVSIRAELRELERINEEQSRQAWRNAKRYAMAYRRLLATASGRAPKELGIAWTAAPSIKKSMADQGLIRRLRDRGAMVDNLQAGMPIEAAVADFVRARLRAGDHIGARSMCHSLQENSGTRVAGYLGSALVAARMHLPELAWASFQEVPRQVSRRLAATEYLTVAMRMDLRNAVNEVRSLTREPDITSPTTCLEIAKLALNAGEAQLARDVLAAVEDSATPDQWAELEPERAWLELWLGGGAASSADAAKDRRISIGVFNYKQPDRRHTSTNIGDYIQTLACLGHVVRHQNLRFSGAGDLPALAKELQDSVRPESKAGTGQKDVEINLVTVNRDASSYDNVPERTWLIAFGWHMHARFGRYDFPYHPNVRPVFVSFHCNRPEMLSPAALEYLRMYGPVGCRDWSTVDLLLGAGVPAFFSGCLTTTTSILFPDLEVQNSPRVQAPVAYVDAEPQSVGTALTHQSDEVGTDGLTVNLRRAVQLLEDYRRNYSEIVTSRLHCYLPAHSLGVKVNFQPQNAADIRFNGLVDVTEQSFAEIQSALAGKLERVVGAIVEGRSESDVYETWREVCKADVEASRARHLSLPAIPAPSFDVASVCARIRSEEVVTRAGANLSGVSAVNVALALDENLKDQMKVVVEAMVEASSMPLRLWILCRGHGPAEFEHMARLFPTVSTVWLPCDRVDYGPVLGMLPHVSMATMDRLLLPDLLPELDRIVYIDIDTLPLGDVSELYNWDLQGHPLAARSAVAVNVVSGYANVWRCTRRLKDRPTNASDLLTRLSANHAFDFRAFNAGVLVLDLARMRRDGFCRNYIPYVERYGMNDQEVLNSYVGSERVDLPPEWNAFPTQEVVDAPRIIHWAGPLKPWGKNFVLLKDRWLERANRVEAREARLRCEHI